jgi:hypothetical protein
MSVTVFPVRVLLTAFVMLLAWPFALAASLGRSEGAVEPQTWPGGAITHESLLWIQASSC